MRFEPLPYTLRSHGLFGAWPFSNEEPAPFWFKAVISVCLALIAVMLIPMIGLVVVYLPQAIIGLWQILLFGDVS